MLPILPNKEDQAAGGYANIGKIRHFVISLKYSQMNTMLIVSNSQ